MALPKRQTDMDPLKYDQFTPPVIKKTTANGISLGLRATQWCMLRKAAISFYGKGGVPKDFKHRNYPRNM